MWIDVSDDEKKEIVARAKSRRSASKERKV